MANIEVPSRAGSAASIISAVKDKFAKEGGGDGTIKAAYPENAQQIRHIKLSAYKTNTSSEEAQSIDEKSPYLGSIIMPLPVDMGYNHTVQYNSKDLLQPTADGGGLKTQALLEKAGATLGKNVLQQVLGDAAEQSLDTLQQAMGARINPYTESLFQAPNLREFQFIFLFYPRTEDEAIQIEKIKRFIRFHMYPSSFGFSDALADAIEKFGEGSDIAKFTREVAEEDKTGTFMGHPSDFIVRFFEPNGERLQATNFIFPCNITNMQILENPQGHSSWLRGSNGQSYPVATQITISVKERQMITRDMWRALDPVPAENTETKPDGLLDKAKDFAKGLVADKPAPNYSDIYPAKDR
jgi:hypothetical protein